MTKYVTPAVNRSAFSCPHCGTLTTQYWHVVATQKLDQFSLPKIFDEKNGLMETLILKEDSLKSYHKKRIDRAAGGAFIIEHNSTKGDVKHTRNLFVSECYECRDYAVWIASRMIHPNIYDAPQINADTPSDIGGDYLEAASILLESPRGSAALLRLAIQKLCIHLGCKGKKIDDDIKALTQRGVGTQVQQAMDVLRVIGNNAVHPGTMDIKDDRDTAISLFKLFNLIVEKTISEPKHVREMFDSLPESAREAIEKRDGKTEALPPPNTKPSSAEPT